MGANISQIYTLLSKEYLILILISFILAVPVAYIFMNQWLEDFTYRTTIGMESFIIPAILLIVIATLAVSYQLIKAALVNPVELIRDE